MHLSAVQLPGIGQHRGRMGICSKGRNRTVNRRSHSYQKGVRAYRAKDYATAHRLLLRLAEEGDDEAQTMIGAMYQLGLGGLQVDEKEASKWYLLASETGNGLASNNLAQWP